MAKKEFEGTKQINNVERIKSVAEMKPENVIIGN